jgi:hypothetical protein
MKTIKSVITSAFLLLLCLTAQAQWAGEDKEVLREEDNSQTVSIGVMDGSSDKCYEWTGPHIESVDTHQPVIIVKPQDAEETYICTRTSSCGVEQDMVKVKVIDTISIVSVTPLKQCYNSGDNLALTDFEIVTYPAGYQSLVHFTPTQVYNNAGASEEQQTITFNLTYNGHTSTKTATVNVFNEDLGLSTCTSVDFHKFIESFKTINSMVEKAKGLSDKLNSIAKNASPCSPDFHLVVTLPQGEDIHACCEGKEIDGFKLSLPSIDANLGIDCYIPTTLSIPHVGGLQIHVGAAIGVALGPMSFNFKRECSNVTIPLGLYANIAGGVQVFFGDPDFFSAELNLVGTGSTSLTWVVGESIKWSPLDVNLKIQGKVTLCSFYTDEVDYMLFTYSFFK